MLIEAVDSNLYKFNKAKVGFSLKALIYKLLDLNWINIFASELKREPSN